MLPMSTVLRGGFVLQDLPERAVPIDGNTLSKVLGGCAKLGETCKRGDKGACCAGACLGVVQPDNRILVFCQ